MCTSNLFQQIAHAQTVVTPTLYCLSAGCPTLAVTKAPSSPSKADEANTTTTTNASPAPNAVTPNVTTSTTDSFYNTQPCSDSSLNSFTDLQASAQKNGSSGDGFLDDIFNFFLAVINFVLNMTGTESGSLPCSPSFSGIPAVSPDTSISEAISPEITNSNPSPASAKTTTTPSLTTQKSANWAGYVINTPVQNNASIVTNWTATQIDCSGGDGHASSWPGMGGWGNKNNSIAQLGTAEVCRHGSSTYYGWTETFPYPVAPLDATTHAVKIGDQFTGSITYKGNGTFDTTMTDKTQGWTVDMPMTINSFTPMTSEIITESSSDYPIVPKFDAISYPKSIYSPDGTTQTPLSAAPKLVKITNNSESGFLRTDTGPINGNTFTTTWTHN